MAFYAGFADADITPPVGIRLLGYYDRSAPSQGILDRLWVVALVMRWDDRRVALVGLDHCGMLVPDTDKLRQVLATDLAIPTSQVAILFTHTHAGPDELDGALGRAYQAELLSKLRQAVREAAERVSPCQVAWGVTRGRIGINRRLFKPNGQVRLGENPEGPVDDRIGLLLFLDTQTGRRLGLIVTCTAHANVLREDNLLISADFPGRVRRLLRGALGCPVLVRNGAAGNVLPLYRGSEGMLERMAMAVSGPVLALLPELTPVENPSLWAGSKSLPLPLQELPTLPQAKQLAQKVSSEWDVDTGPWLERVRTLLAHGQRMPQPDVEVHLLRVGKFVLAGVPMEPFAELAMAVQERLGNPMAFFGGYTNGWLGYLPSAEECLRGGFEVERVPTTYGLDSGMIMPPRPEAAERVVEAVVQLHQRSLEGVG